MKEFKLNYKTNALNKTLTAAPQYSNTLSIQTVMEHYNQYIYNHLGMLC